MDKVTLVAKLALEKWRAERCDYARREEARLAELVNVYAGVYALTGDDVLTQVHDAARAGAWELKGRL